MIFKRISKCILGAVACTAVMLMCISPIHAAAQEMVYKVDSADFDITLLENGDAIITENWTVTYQKGSFTRFYKDIFNPGNQLEYISGIDVLSCHINGKDAERQYSTERISGHYYFQNDDPQMFTIHWFQAAQDQTVNYDITYQITDAVKLDESDQAEFCTRLIGQDFPKTVENVHASVKLPYGSSFHDYTVSDGNADIDGNNLDCRTYNLNGMYKLHLFLDAQGFDDLQRIISVSVPAGLSEDENISRSGGSGSSDGINPREGILVYTVVGIPILLVIVLYLAPKLKLKKILADNPNAFQDAARNIQNTGIPYVWYIFRQFGVYAYSYIYGLAFHLEIFDLCRKGYLTITPNCIRFNRINDTGAWDPLQRNMDHAFLNFLTSYFPTSYDINGTVIPFNAVRTVFEDQKSGRDLLEEIKNWVTQYQNNLNASPLYQQIGQSEKKKEIRKWFDLWRKYSYGLKMVVPVSECYEILERTGNIDSYTVLQLRNNPFGCRSSVSNAKDTDDMYYFLYYVESNTYVSSGSNSTSSGSGCSSCSSCSSCSGCGGGGAD